MSSKPATIDEQLQALNQRMNTLETDVRARLTQLDAFLASPPAGARGLQGPAGPQGPPGPVGPVPDLTPLQHLEAELRATQAALTAAQARLNQVADDGQARIERAITQVNLVTKGRDS
ncbi:hypothetical protein GO986_16245 [Deinococcus sp. HMF7620]|uniref:Collagen-like protein n=1 Tax=Deinococcus arboris TaxID=2682977 RepID=A0A7C9LNR9_9DEIO|nr:hypothetical protein [Deinococcus arboris]MVN88297.1 hypothetical protein [Deinococcus arboris]